MKKSPTSSDDEMVLVGQEGRQNGELPSPARAEGKGRMAPAEMSALIKKSQEIHRIMEHKVDLRLPRIVVIGDQSSGKSSTLETLIRRDFLPRGKGCVTRCPLVLILKHVEDTSAPEVILFPADKGGNGERTFTNPDWSEVSEEIRRRMVDKAGNKSNIVDEPIGVCFVSPHVPDLELVDLPGFTRNPKGGQPSNIAELTRDLSLKYIEHDKTIILAVTAANVDIHTSEALKLARQVDPRGLRTIGVLTKPDTVEAGPDLEGLINVLANKEIPLKKGYFSIKNRSTREMDKGVTASQASKKEEQFFLERKEFSRLLDRTGSANLLKELCRELAQSLKDSLPDLRREIDGRIEEAERDLRKLGHNSNLEGDMKPEQLIYALIDNFKSLAKQGIYGLEDVEDSADLDGMLKGSDMRLEICKQLKEACRSAKEPEELEQLKRETAAIVGKTTGIRDSALAPVHVIEFLVERLVRGMRQSCLDVADDVNQMLVDFMREVADKTLEAYPKVKDQALVFVEEVIEDNRKKTHSAIGVYLDGEQGSVNLEHPRFTMMQRHEWEERREENLRMQRMLNGRKDGHRPEQEEQEEDKQLLQAEYFMDVVRGYMRDVVLVNLRDVVPKLIISHLISRTVKQDLGRACVLPSKLLTNADEDVDKFVERTPKVDILLKRREQLKKVKRVLMDTRDLDRSLN